jgi:hypothetical protein
VALEFDKLRNRSSQKNACSRSGDSLLIQPLCSYRITRSDAAVIKFEKTFFIQSCVLGALEIAKNGISESVGPFLARFFAFP